MTLNYVWELTQSSLYVGINSLAITWWHCGIAALGGGLLVILIYGIGRLVLRRLDWFINPGLGAYTPILIAGLIIGIDIELTATRILGLWEYSPTISLFPVMKLGFTLVSQMLVLLPLIFRIVSS